MLTPLALFGNLGVTEVIIIAAIALLIFGPQLPKVARWFGKSVSEFKHGMNDMVDKVNEEPPRQDSQAKSEPKGKDTQG